VTDLNDEERQYLVELLERRLESLLHELHHATTRHFKEGLRQEVALTERLREKLAAAGTR